MQEVRPAIWRIPFTVATIIFALSCWPLSVYAGYQGMGWCPVCQRDMPDSHFPHTSGGSSGVDNFDNYAPLIELGTKVGIEMSRRIIEDLFSSPSSEGFGQKSHIQKIGEANSKGIEYLNQEKFDMAIKCFEEALSYGPDYQNIKDNLKLARTCKAYKQAIAYEEKGDLDNAIKCFEEAVSYDPDHDDLRKLLHLYKSKRAYEIAFAYYERRDYRGAIESYEQALELDPVNPYIKEKLVQARSVEANHKGDEYTKKGDYANAVYWYNEALKHDPENPAAIENLRRIKTDAKLDNILDNLSSESGTSPQTSSTGDFGFKGEKYPVFSKGTKASSVPDLSFKDHGKSLVIHPRTVKGQATEVAPDPEMLFSRTEKVTTFNPLSSNALELKDPSQIEVKTHTIPSLPTGPTLHTKEVPPPVNSEASYNVAIGSIKGENVYRKTAEGWEQIKDSTQLKAGDIVQTGPDSSVEIVVNDRQRWIIGPRQSFVYEGVRDKSTGEKMMDFLKGKKTRPKGPPTGGIRQ